MMITPDSPPRMNIAPDPVAIRIVIRTLRSELTQLTTGHIARCSVGNTQKRIAELGSKLLELNTHLFTLTGSFDVHTPEAWR